MNIKKSIAGLIAGFALVGSIAAPAALADPGSTAVVVVGDGGGQIAVAVCDVTMAPGTNPTASTPGIVDGLVKICYTNDTASYRAGFNTALSATVFTGTNPAHTIAASNFVVTQTNNIAQGQWSGLAPLLPHIGDIGFLASNGTIAPGQSSPTGNSVWSADNSLDTGRNVQFGYAGRGTLWSNGNVNVRLTIPSGTIADTYSSELSVTMTPAVHP